MTQAVNEESGDAALTAEAQKLGIDPAAYVELSPRERQLLKAREVKRLRGEARRHGVEAEEYLAMSVEERAEMRRRAADRVRRHVDSDKEEETKSTGEPEFYTARDAVPPREATPSKRTKMTIGEIELDPAINQAELSELQRTPPATLMDIYSRWPIGDPDGAYRLRVERVQPKVYQGMAVAGYVGEIKTPISEAQFQSFFGGREYDLTLYGPDPSGRHDQTSGLPKIVRLTRPFRITVPLLPPNIAVLPAAVPEPSEENPMMQNPFAVAVPPTSSADAAVHKTNVDFVSSTIKMAREDAVQTAKSNADTQKTLIEVMQEQNKQILETERDNAARREKVLEDDRRELRQKLERMERELEGITGKRGLEAVELLKHTKSTESDAVRTTSDMYQRQIDTMTKSHSEAIERLKESQADVLRALRDQHAQEIKRLEARLSEQETYYARILADERRKADEREKQLKDDVERVRREERDNTAQRLSEQKERFEDRIKDLDTAHRREVTSVKENVETRKEVSEAQLKMEIASLKERLDEVREQLEAARSEAEENKDPVAVIAKAKEQAERLGYKEDKDEAKGWDKFLSVAGAGIGQFIQDAPKWLPDAMAKMNAAKAQQQQLGQAPAGQLGAGGAPQQQRPAQRRPVSWGSEGDPSVARPSVAPGGDLGFQQPAANAPPAAPQATTQATPPAPPQPTAQASAPPSSAPAPQAPQAQAGPQVPAFNNIFRDVFGDNDVLGFLQNVENGINTMEPGDFAEIFIQRAPEEADKLVHSFSKDDVVRFVREFPGAEASPILRRDGLAWIDKMLTQTKKLVAKRKQAA